MVIGVRSPGEKGGFGKYHAARLAERDDTDTLFVTRTNYDAAVRTAEEIKDGSCRASDVVGVKISTPRNLRKFLENEEVDFISIAAKRPVEDGDSIHEEYLQCALENSKGRVFVDKPYKHPTGDESNLAFLRKLSKNPAGSRVSMNMPAYLGMHELLKQVPKVRSIIGNAGEMDVFWGVNNHGKPHVGSNLGTHALEAPASVYKNGVITKSTGHEGDYAVVDAEYSKPDGNSCKCRIYLSHNFPFRGFKMGKYGIIVETEKIDGDFWDVFYEAKMSSDCIGFEKPVTSRAYTKSDVPLIKLNNPLRTMISAAIEGHAYYGVDKMLRSQEMLEDMYSF